MKKLNIALVAHDSRKKELATWFKFNIDVLLQHNLFGTGTTAKILNEVIDEYIEDLPVIDNCDDVEGVTFTISGKAYSTDSIRLDGGKVYLKK